jgi:hypothetical protein
VGRNYATPEEAARGDIPERFVRVVGVVVRGDEAVVAQLTNDGPYEVETAWVHRQQGGWTCGQSGNGTSTWIPTGDERATAVVWDGAPPGAVAARFECGDLQQVVAVENGAALGLFDDLSEEDAALGVARLAAWIDQAGNEEKLPRYERSERMRAKIREYLSQREE